jgi:anaerobic dimethyl sulfoxide reductase subunit B (iron-sulfur subunit)
MIPKQRGFYFDVNRCVQCHACELACKSFHGVALGVRWRRVVSIWQGEYPNVLSRGVSIACLHCASPACEAVCPMRAIEKRSDDGIVVVDQNKCIGCHCCSWVCPFGIPQFGLNGKMQKCQLCLDRVALGEDPPCVATCPSEALLWGPMDKLAERAAKKTAQKHVAAALSHVTEP